MGKATSNRLLYFFVAIGALVPVVVAVAAWRFLQTDLGGFVSSIGSLAVRRMNSPGVAELRRIGCEQTVVLTVGEVFQASMLSDGDREKLARDRPMLACNDYYGRRPTCEEVAMTYAPFASTQDRAIVRVTSRGKAICDGVYSASGEFLAERSKGMFLGELEPQGVEPADELPSEGEAP